MSKVATHKKKSKKRREPIPADEWANLKWGVITVAIFVVGLGLLMFFLIRSGEPDSQSLVIQPDHSRELIDFSLVDQSGRAFTRRELEGKIVVVNFLFTSCSVVCPYVNAQMAKIQQMTSNQPNVKLLSLTIDPVDDTVAVLSKYGQNFGQDPERWSFLTGDETTMHNLIGTSFLPQDTTGEFSYMPGNFANTQRIVLVDAKGHIVEYFDGLNQDAADAVVKEIAKLRQSQS